VAHEAWLARIAGGTISDAMRIAPPTSRTLVDAGHNEIAAQVLMNATGMVTKSGSIRNTTNNREIAVETTNQRERLIATACVPVPYVLLIQRGARPNQHDGNRQDSEGNRAGREHSPVAVVEHLDTDELRDHRMPATTPKAL
jgi:hypothetical protein